MRLGVAIEETWDFFREVYAELEDHHETRLFRRPRVPLPFLRDRLKHRCLRREMAAFLRGSDVVFFEWASELLALASRMPKVCGLVARLHRYEMYTWANKVNWDAVDRLILVSEAKLREFTAAFPAHARKAIVIPEAVSLTRFRPRPRRFNGDIGILGHMKPRKRVYELVLAFYELVTRRPGFHLHIGGGRAEGFAEYYEAVTQLVDRLGLRPHVTFYGHIERPEDWYSRIDVFISNGYSEGLQVSPMEAMASGCYCLSHHWDGAEELLPSSHLFYTNAQLVDLLIAYAERSDGEKTAATAALQRMVGERFDVDRTKVQIRQIVEEVAASTAVA